MEDELDLLQLLRAGKFDEAQRCIIHKNVNLNKFEDSGMRYRLINFLGTFYAYCRVPFTFFLSPRRYTRQVGIAYDTFLTSMWSYPKS